MANVNITGLSDSRSAACAGRLIHEQGGRWLVVTETHKQAEQMASDLSFFVSKKIYLMPPEDKIFVNYEARSRESLFERLRILKAMAAEEEYVVIASCMSLTRKLPPPCVLQDAGFVLKTGQDLDMPATVRRLVDIGYERVPLIYAPGQFAVRGEILDIFTPYDQLPVRIELFDTEIESMRSFDLTSQRSVNAVAQLEVSAATLLVHDDACFARAEKLIRRQYKGVPERMEALLDSVENMVNTQQLEYYLDYFYEEPAMLWDYLGEDGRVIVDDPNRCWEDLEAAAEEFRVDFEVYLEQGRMTAKDYERFLFTGALARMYAARQKSGIWFFTMFARSLRGVDHLDAIESFPTQQVLSYNGRMDILRTDLQRYVDEGYKVILVCAEEARKENMEDFLDRSGLRQRVWVEVGTLSKGMVLTEEKICYITDADIFGAVKRSKRRRRHKADKKTGAIRSFSEIAEGDLVVHEAHGIGRYMGLEKLSVAGETRDYLKISYAGNDVLYVPAEQMDLIRKYIGADAAAPKINKLSGGEWRAAKAKARASVANMANELLQISAARAAAGGHAFPKDSVWQREFEDSFPYEETPDQLQAIAEIKADMEKPVAMDRLLCGDVGYGKTEVAARAIFKCVEDGKQAAVLVPTTVLASQHYSTLKARFADYPFEFRLLSRFRTAAEQKKSIAEIREGRVDVIIGTHRLLSDDVVFKDLGLLVVDEEQRFGVAHKEKIKKLKKNVDVLMLSATPIPRTLHMSLLGIRSMSLLEEPPKGRYPVQTYVMEEDDHILREVITRELDRGGQVFVIHNRVSEINRIAAKVGELVPEARVAAGHGRMHETQLEDVVMGFIHGESDVLVATTIVENGVDIPNANTVIVLDADNFGLSQLYQIRGRVGRSGRMAYAYLMHRKGKVLTQVAEKRLRAIKDFTEFGAGFKIAMKDLEIRGAGNILGSEQHGHMVNVGYDLYCRMVDDAVRALKGEKVSGEREEVTIDIPLTAYIPDRYIPDESTKLEMYQRIAEIDDADEQKAVTEELEDRFGRIPLETRNLMYISRIRRLAEDLDIRKLSQEGPDRKTLLLVFREGIHPRSQKLFLQTRGDHLQEMITLLTQLKQLRREREAAAKEPPKEAPPQPAKPVKKVSQALQHPDEKRGGGRYAGVHFSCGNTKNRP